jgi:two-component system NtrC family sensor kinase
LNKIFEPFFSTKGNDDGTGSGLSIGHRIIQNHGGRIEVESEVGSGSRFRIYLPLHASLGAKE